MHNDKQAVPENKAAAIQEALSWHAGERDDLTLDESVEVIRHGWETVHGRSERQLVLQIAALLAQPAASQAVPAVPEGFKLLRNSTVTERSWKEDEAHENGNYSCECCECGRTFFGHKRRVVCKVCAAVPADKASEKSDG
jgi:hypothetical protein